MRTAIILGFFTLAGSVHSQNLKLQIKPFVGGHVGVFRGKLETVERNLTVGYQGGFSFRISKERVFLEPGFLFLKDYIQMSDTLVQQFVALGINDPKVRYNTFEFPVVVGYKFVDNKLFKWFVAGGLAMNVSIKSNLISDREKIAKFKAKDLGLANPRFHMRMGTGIDLAFFTLGMYYNLGLNSVSRTVYRTQAHAFEFNIGVLY